MANINKRLDQLEKTINPPGPPKITVRVVWDGDYSEPKPGVNVIRVMGYPEEEAVHGNKAAD